MVRLAQHYVDPRLVALYDLENAARDDTDLYVDLAASFTSYAADPAETTSGQGRWANGSSIDGKGEFNYIPEPFAVGQVPHLNPGDPTTHTAPPGGYENDGIMSKPGLMVEKVVSKVTGKDNG